MCFFLCEVNAGRKALLVGISKYPQNSGWREISSSNDLELLASILKGHASVTILSGERASKAGIIMALKKLRGKPRMATQSLYIFQATANRCGQTTEKRMIC